MEIRKASTNFTLILSHRGCRKYWLKYGTGVILLIVLTNSVSCSQQLSLVFRYNGCKSVRIYQGPATGHLDKDFLDGSQVTVCYYILPEGQDSLFGIATGYGLDGPGSNPGGGRDFCTRPDLPWCPPSLMYNGYHVYPGGKAAASWRRLPTSI